MHSTACDCGGLAASCYPLSGRGRYARRVGHPRFLEPHEIESIIRTSQSSRVRILAFESGGNSIPGSATSEGRPPGGLGHEADEGVDVDPLADEKEGRERARANLWRVRRSVLGQVSEAQRLMRAVTSAAGGSREPEGAMPGWSFPPWQHKMRLRGFGWRETNDRHGAPAARARIDFEIRRFVGGEGAEEEREHDAHPRWHT